MGEFEQTVHCAIYFGDKVDVAVRFKDVVLKNDRTHDQTVHHDHSETRVIHFDCFLLALQICFKSTLVFLPNLSNSQEAEDFPVFKNRHLSNDLKRKVEQTVDQKESLHEGNHLPLFQLRKLLLLLLILLLGVLDLSLDGIEFNLLLIDHAFKLGYLVGIVINAQLCDGKVELLNFGLKLIPVLFLLDLPLIKYLGSISQSEHEAKHITQRDDGLLHDRHEEDDENGEDVEGEVHED